MASESLGDLHGISDCISEPLCGGGFVWSKVSNWLLGCVFVLNPRDAVCGFLWSVGFKTCCGKSPEHKITN